MEESEKEADADMKAGEEADSGNSCQATGTEEKTNGNYFFINGGDGVRVTNENYGK